MEKIFFRDIQMEYSEDALISFATNHADLAKENMEIVGEMAKASKSVARPKGVCCIAKITDRSEQWVEIEGTRVTSQLVAHNLENIHRIFPYVVTCGTELDKWSKKFTDPLKNYYADRIKLFYLKKIGSYMKDKIKARYFVGGHLSCMNPGSLKEEWPLSQQAVLFSIIGRVTEDIGVSLTPSLLMVPTKSQSGFYFSSKEEYVNCQFCPILNCPERRAPYKGVVHLRSVD